MGNHTYYFSNIFIFSKFIDEKRVYNEVEYYLPQFVHLIINLDDSASYLSVYAMEDLLLTLSKTSMHTAQQLHFILLAALEDNQPENADGAANKTKNISRYFRCARMLKRVEQIVIFRKVVSVQQSIEEDKLNKPDDPLLPDTSEFVKKGFLLYKRVTRKSMFMAKPWKRRYFSVHYRVLSCYRNADDREPLRSIFLPGCVLLTDLPDSKYEFAFTLHSKTTDIKFQLRAGDEVTYKEWIDFIRRYY